MSVERVLPRTLDYTDVLPLAVESKSRRRTFFPTNGNQFNSDGNNIIRIDLSADALLDTQHSYLRFTATSRIGTAGLDPAGGHAFISRLRVEQSGTVLEDIQSYNKLMGAIVLPCQGSSEYDGIRTMTEGQHAKFSSANNANAQPRAGPAAYNAAQTTALGFEAQGLGTNGIDQLDIDGAVDICIPLTSGLLNCEKLVPLMLMSAPLTIEIELAQAAEAVSGSAGVTIDFSNVRYIANLVEVGNEVGQQLRMLQEMSGGVLTLTGQTYRHFSGSIAAAGANTLINVPARVKSMKSIFFNCPGHRVAGATGPDIRTYDVGTGGHNNIDSYQFKIGSVTYPPTPVRCNFGTAGANAEASVAGETLMELEKAWGNVGSRMGLGSKTRALGFYSHPAIRAVPIAAGGGAALTTSLTSQRYAPFGMDMEAFQRVAIESGVNTADRSLPITLELTHTVSVASQCDVYVLADALFYINSDGSMSVSV
tara:strand:+ start:4550 stop:5989 length:1440 start_codon:yes stop_codon:yes gene_type:complete